MEWELRHVEDVEAVLDDSGVYVIVHRVEQTETHKEHSGVHVSVRADLMTNTNTPDTSYGPCIMSFQGTANAVRKALIRYVRDNPPNSRRAFQSISLEHASYIGYELLRAETDPDYVQD